MDLLPPVKLEVEHCLGEPYDVLVLQPDGSIAYGLDELVEMVLVDGLGGPFDVLEDLVRDGGSNELGDAFRYPLLRSDGGLNGVILAVGFVAGFHASELGLHCVGFASSGCDGCGGGVTEDTVGGDTVGGLDGCEGVHGMFGECVHPLA